jgi:Ca-activated chloride channel family protein
MILGNPWFLLLFPLIAVALWWSKKTQKNKVEGILFPDTAMVVSLENPWIRRWMRARPWIRLGVIFLVAMALIRPQIHSRLTEIVEPGVDIVMALDASGSMLAEDFKPDNRITAAKKVATEFILQRPNDRIGMVVFGSYALTQCPLTTDRQVLTTLVDKIKIGMAGDGTAIGLGIATAVNRLRTSDAKSKVIVLMTDGINNAGEIVPEEAAKLAREYRIKIYAIGIGKEGGAPIPVMDPVVGKTFEKNADGSVALTEIDEKPLRAAAQISGGRYFRATDDSALKSIYKQIDQLEKTESTMKAYYQTTDLFPWFLWAAVILLLAEMVLGQWIWRPLP